MGAPGVGLLGLTLAPEGVTRLGSCSLGSRREPPAALLPGGGFVGARSHGRPLLSQHGPPPRARARAEDRAGRGHDPVSRGAAAVLAASAIASQAREARGRLAALRGMHDVRDRVPGALHLHRRGRAPEPGDREGPRALRYRPGQVRLLRLLCGGVPGGRDPDGHGRVRVLRLQPGRDDLHEGDAAGPRARGPRRPSDLAGPDPGGSEAVMAYAGFFVVAAIAVSSALGLVLRRNAIHGALFLVVNLGSIAALYQTLGAEFLAWAQVIVYAGAIMVLFVFAIMVLIPGKEETGPDPRRAWRLLALPAGALLFLQLIFVVGRAPGGAPTGSPPVGGGVESIAGLLFTRYLFPFELTSVLLLAAMVGVLLLARRRV